jgi:hypothetical protein
VVDMEAAAFFAVARFRRCRVRPDSLRGRQSGGPPMGPARMESPRDARAAVSSRRSGLPAAVIAGGAAARHRRLGSGSRWLPALRIISSGRTAPGLEPVVAPCGPPCFVPIPLVIHLR